jgi:prolyl 4-hydroxylase
LLHSCCIFFFSAWNPGDLDRMFERILHDASLQEKYNITILSRPIRHDESHHDKQFHEKDDDPWILQIDNFITEEEANRFIDLGHIIGYERSKDAGPELENGEYDKRITKSRTSTNAWCETVECLNEARNIYHRMEELTKIPMINSEHIQLLKYEHGQFYKEHHDYVKLDYDRSYGVRILTIYMYLNNVPAGGGTQFTKLKNGPLTVLPKVGRALIWPSVFNEFPHKRDIRTTHQALPVEGNETDVKYGANVWIHQREIVKNCM